MSYFREFALDITVYDPSKVFHGYTLFAPMSTNDAFLIDMEGNIVHHWKTPFPPAQHGRLLPNGNLLFWPQKGKEPKIPVGGVGSDRVELDWDGNVVWRHEDDVINHDFQRLENGNTLFNRYVRVPDKIAKKVKGGVPDSEAEGQIFGSALREVDRDGKTVWEWFMYEHMDPEKDAQCPLCPRSIWGYINSVGLTRDGNILCTFRFENCVAKIEKKTGNVIWRWGSEFYRPPALCHRDRKRQYPPLPTARIGRAPKEGRTELAYSRLVEVNPKTNEVVWEYHDPNVFNFYSSICGGAQRLPNGNTLATSVWAIADGVRVTARNQ